MKDSKRFALIALAARCRADRAPVSAEIEGLFLRAADAAFV
jgi:hypothetical protein